MKMAERAAVGVVGLGDSVRPCLCGERGEGRARERACAFLTSVSSSPAQGLEEQAPPSLPCEMAPSSVLHTKPTA